MTEEEKDKLIALSDLNREDNIKYISSEAQGIAITLDSDRYAPTFCKLERAYICGRRKSEEQIAELEKENADLKEEINKIAFARGNLEEENAELRKVAEFQQSSNINKYFENKKLKEGLAVGSTFNKALNSMNKTLEEERDKYRNMVFDKDEELNKWKDEWQEQVQKATDEGYVRTLQTIQLNNAKEIIREFVEWATWQGSNCPNFKDIQDKAEQFLSEVEK